MNSRPLKTSEIEYMVGEGESENRTPVDPKMGNGSKKNPKGKGTGSHSIGIREKRWKEDVREKTEVKAIGQ